MSLPLRAYRQEDSFNYSREHSHLVHIFRLRDKISLNVHSWEPKLKLVCSSWQRQWIHSAKQIEEICKELNMNRQEVEYHITTNRLHGEKEPPRDLDSIMEAINWVLGQIRKETPPAQQVIFMRAQGIAFKNICRMYPRRSYTSMLDDYTKFLRRVYGCREYEFLRKRRRDE